MDTLQIINQFKEFIEDEYQTEILESSRKGLRYLTINFEKLIRFNPTLSDLLLDDPEETVKAIKFAIEQIPKTIEGKEFEVQINNLPPSSKTLVSGKRTKDIGKLHSFEGVIRSKSTVLSRTESIRFECPACGNKITVLQKENKKRAPTRCGCGRKGKFRELDKKSIDAQKIELEELPENVKGTSQPQRLKILLTGFLVDPQFEPKFNPGAKVLITGILKDLPIHLRNGVESIESDFILNGLHIENIEDEEIDLNITPEDQSKFDEISTRPDYIKTLKDSLIPSIYGHEKIKEGILLQLVSGVRKISNDGTSKRGDIHILVIGDPGAGKSAMLQRVEKILPHARVANGKGASGVGLTCAVVRDEFIGWTFQAGTLVLAHKNVAIIDEFDKMSKEDRDQIHEALEQQTVTIAKAGVQARLNCECSLLAGANPKYGRFDPYAKTIAEQIDLPPTIINRFDLIYTVKDKPDEKKDELTANKIMDTHENGCDDCGELDTAQIRKYIFLAKKLMPTFTPEARKFLVNYYLTIRNKAKDNDGIKAIPISARQLEGLIRLSEAYAKLRLSKKIEKKDAINATEILDHCLKQIAFDEEAGTIDIDMVGPGTPASKRNKISIVKRIIEDLEQEIGKNIPKDEIITAATEKSLTENEVDETLDILKSKGDIFEPRRGFISKL